MLFKIFEKTRNYGSSICDFFSKAIDQGFSNFKKKIKMKINDSLKLEMITQYE
jgi:hypothetical protein